MPTRLTLLCGANPTRAERGPLVRVQAGTWKIQCDGIDDSILSVTLETSNVTIPAQHDRECTLLESGNVFVDFVTRGKEKYVSIYLERVA